MSKAKVKAKTRRIDSAYKKAVEEIDKDRVNEIKVMLKATIEAIFERQKKRADLDKEIRFLQDDIRDLKQGKLDKIKKRREQDSQLAKVSKLDLPKLENWQWMAPAVTNDLTWRSTTAPHTLDTGNWTTSAATNLANLVQTAIKYDGEAK